MKLGIFVHFDPSVRIINTEIGFLNGLVEMLKPTSVTFIKCMGRLDGMLARGNYEFPYDVSTDHMFECDYLATWNSTNMSNFFGGMVSENFVKFYEAMSAHTNAGKPVLFRAGDSENEIYDYREMVMGRAKNQNFVDKNADAVKRLTDSAEIDYSKFFILANGEKDRFDWVTDTYTVRTESKLTVEDCEQALYLGDDLFFQVSEHKREMSPGVVPYSDELFWIGFIDGRNSRRYKMFQELFPASNAKFKLQSNKEVDLKGATCVCEAIEGDTPNYFKHLASHLGYIFIGKGNSVCSYVNKTVYDCYIAGIPLLIYKSTDTTGMIFDHTLDCYFSNATELDALYQRLVSETGYRQDLIARQATEIEARLAKGNQEGLLLIESLKQKHPTDYTVIEKSKTLLEF